MIQHEWIRTSRLQTLSVVPSTLWLDRPLGDPLADSCTAPEQLLLPFPRITIASCILRTFLKVYMELGSSFLFLQEQIKDIIIIC